MSKLTTNVSARIPFDLIATADEKLQQRGIVVGSMNELLRVVLMDFCTDMEQPDDYTAYKHVESRFMRKKPIDTLSTDEIRSIAEQLRETK